MASEAQEKTWHEFSLNGNRTRNPNVMNIRIENNASVAQILGTDIFYLRYNDNCTSKMVDLIEGYDAYLKLANGTNMKVLVEAGKHSYFDIEANDCVKNGKIQPIAEAIVSDSLAIRLVTDYYIHSRKKQKPN